MVKWYQKKELLKRFEAQNEINRKKFHEAKAKYLAEHQNDPHVCETCDEGLHNDCQYCSCNPNAKLEDMWNVKIPHELWEILREGMKEIRKEFGVE